MFEGFLSCITHACMHVQIRILPEHKDQRISGPVISDTQGEWTMWRFGGTGFAAISASLPRSIGQLYIKLAFIPPPLLSSVSSIILPSTITWQAIAGLVSQSHIRSSLLYSPWALVTSYRVSVSTHEWMEKRPLMHYFLSLFAYARYPRSLCQVDIWKWTALFVQKQYLNIQN